MVVISRTGDSLADILSNPSVCVNLSSDPQNSGINFIDRRDSKLYKLTSDDIARQIFQLVQDDKTLINGRCVAEFTASTTAGLTLEFGGLDVNDLLSILANEFQDLNVASLDIYIRANTVIIPQLRGPTVERRGFARHLSNRFRIKIVAIHENLIYPPEQHYVLRRNMFQILIQAVAPLPTNLSDISVLLPSTDMVRLHGYADVEDKSDIDAYVLIKQRILKIPEINFAHRLIETLANANWELFASHFRRIIWMLVATNDQDGWLFYGATSEQINTTEFRELALCIINQYTIDGRITRSGTVEDFYDLTVLEMPRRKPGIIELMNLCRTVTTPDQFKALIKDFICGRIIYTFKTQGTIYNLDIVDTIYFIYCYKYATMATGMSGSQVVWYRFNEKDSQRSHFKWQRVIDIQPQQLDIMSQLSYYLATIRQTLVNELHAMNIDLSGKKTTDADLQQYVRCYGGMSVRAALGILTQLDHSIKTVKSFHVGDRVFNTIGARLSRQEYLRQLDRDPFVLGVENGIVLLAQAGHTTEPRLIQSHHNYAVSRTTNGRILPANHEAVKWLREKWQDYFYEPDVADWILMYWSQALDGYQKAALMLFLIAPGGHAKTFWSDLHSESLNCDEDGYSTKLNSHIFGVHRGDANSHGTAMYALKDRRQGMVSEGPGEHFTTNKMKQILSQESTSTRQIFQAEETVKLNATITYVGNHEPKFDHVDYGSRRRIRAYSPKYKYSPDPNPNNPFERKDDPKFNKEIKGSRLYQSAWLTMLLEAHTKLQNEYGGNMEAVPVPYEIARYTTAMVTESDIVGRFAIACLEYCEDATDATTMSLDDFQRNFMSWIEAQKITYAMNQSLAALIGDSMLNKFYDIKVRQFVGIRLRQETNESSNYKPFTSLMMMSMLGCQILGEPKKE